MDKNIIWVIVVISVILLATSLIGNTVLRMGGACINYQTECWDENINSCEWIETPTDECEIWFLRCWKYKTTKNLECESKRVKRCSDKCVVYELGGQVEFQETMCPPNTYRCNAGDKQKCSVDGFAWLPTGRTCNPLIYDAIDNSFSSGIRVWYDETGVKHITKLGVYALEKSQSSIFSVFRPFTVLNSYTCSSFPDEAYLTNYQPVPFVCPSSTLGGCVVQFYGTDWSWYSQINFNPGESTNPIPLAWGNIQGYDVYYCNIGGVTCNTLFQDAGCGAGQCIRNEMLRTRDCPFDFIGDTWVCVWRSECEPEPTPDPVPDIPDDPEPQICIPNTVAGSMCDTSSSYYTGRVNGYGDIILFYCNSAGTGVSPVTASCIDQNKVCDPSVAQCVAYQWDIIIKVILRSIGILQIYQDPYLRVYYP